MRDKTVNNNKVLNRIGDLVQLDIDAVVAYEQVLKVIDDEEIRKKISSFCANHVRHIDDLSRIMAEFGETAPDRLPDVKGLIMKGFAAVRGATGTVGALKAMQINEELTNKAYKDALKWDLPEDVRNIINKNYADQRKHLAYIKEVIKENS